MSYPPTSLVSADAQLRQRSFLGQVYAWMTAGLLVTSAVAAYAASAPSVLNLIYGNPVTIWLLFLAQIGLVIGLSAAIDRLAPLAAVALFVGYAALNGLTLAAGLGSGRTPGRHTAPSRLTQIGRRQQQRSNAARRRQQEGSINACCTSWPRSHGRRDGR